MSDTQVEQLVKMAQQISRNMAAEGDAATVARKTAEHIGKFWTPAMRRQLVELSQQSTDLPHPLAAVASQLQEA